MQVHHRPSRKTVLSVALAACLSLAAVPAAFAQNTTGSVVGRTAPGATVTISSPSTGFSRMVTAEKDGSYRIPFLPVGDYQLSTGGAPVEVTVTLGNATTVNIGSAGATQLGAVNVTANRVISASS